MSTFIQKLTGRANVDIDVTETDFRPTDDRTLLQKMADSVNVSITNLITRRTNLEEEIADKQEELRQVNIGLKAMDAAKVELGS